MDRFLRKRTASRSSRRSVDVATLTPRSRGSLAEAAPTPDLRTNKTSMSRGEPLVKDFQPLYDSNQDEKQHGRDPVQVPGVKSATVEDAPPPASPTFSSSSEDDEAPAPPDFSGRQIRTPTRPRSPDHAMGSNRHLLPLDSNGSAKNVTHMDKDGRYLVAPSLSMPATPESRDRSSIASRFSTETGASSVHLLAPLQAKGLPDEADRLQPVMEVDDPTNFDLLAAPPEEMTGIYQMERRAELLLSSKHLEMIFSEPRLLLKFTTYLNTYRPQSIPILIFYLDALKAQRAIDYANAISEALEPIAGFQFTEEAPESTRNTALAEKAAQAFEVLVREDLPAYIVHVWIQVVSISIQRRITGTMAPHLREASEGLAEVFCLSDPSRTDNPIVFASEEFHRTTQYGMSYAIGRNCRFLQGPRTNPNSVRRLAMACKAGKEHSEVFVNYRRDGSPFMNLLMVAPLFDSKGTLRYFIGAQVDVSGLLKDCSGTELEAFANLVTRDEDPESAAAEDFENQKDEFHTLSEMFNTAELETVRNHGGRMHRDQVDDGDLDSVASHRPRLLLKDPGSEVFNGPPRNYNRRSIDDNSSTINGRLEGVYQHYLLVRPAPSLRILFTSPSLRVPGILQSPFLSRIGGSSRVKADLSQAMSEGRGVTAKIRWLTRIDEEGESEGRTRWIHATPLYGHQGTVGVWMVVLVDQDSSAGEGRRRFKPAPAVSNSIGGKEYSSESTRERREREQTKIERLLPTTDSGSRDMDGTGDWDSQLASSSGRPRSHQHIASLDRRSTASMLNGRGGTDPSELSFQLR